MPKTPDSSSPFESASERPLDKPIWYFTRRVVDQITGQEREQKMVSLYLRTEEEEKNGEEVLPIDLEVYDPEQEGGGGSVFEESEFNNFILDDAAKELLRHYATGARLDHPSLIEGPTDIGKSKVLEYLAHLTNHKLVRISVKGTTDPSEFFGKHVPESETAQKKILHMLGQRAGLSEKTKRTIEKARQEGGTLSLNDLKQMVENDLDGNEDLHGSTIAMMKDAAVAGRGLSKDEWETLASIEGIDLEGKMFKWQDGEIVKAMSANSGNGYWLYIDEIGSAEPQILIALNRILEQQRRIELSEDGGRFVQGGHHFRIFSSTNPPEYAGRLPLAPDFIRRFSYMKVGLLPEKIVRERFSYIMNQPSSHEQEVGRPELEEEITNLFSLIVPSYFMTLRTAVKNLIGKQKQKFSYEFTDLIRVRDYIKELGYDNPMAALRSAMNGLFGKIGDEDKRKGAKEDFNTFLKNEKVEDKVREIVSRRKPLVIAKKGLESTETMMAEF